MGFASMAIKHGCTIVPVINYGTEDLFKVVKDISLDWVPVPFLFQSGRTLPLFLPRTPVMRKHVLPGRTHRARVFFWFAPPIRTDHIAGQDNDEAIVRGIRDKTKTAIEDGIEYLKNLSVDYERYYGRAEPVEEDPEEREDLLEEDGKLDNRRDAAEEVRREDFGPPRRKPQAFLSSWSLSPEEEKEDRTATAGDGEGSSPSADASEISDASDDPGGDPGDPEDRPESHETVTASRL